MTKHFFLAKDGEITSATAETDWNGHDAVLIHARDEAAAITLAQRYDADEIQPDNVWHDGKAVTALS